MATTLKQLQGEIDDCVATYSDETAGHDTRGHAFFRLQALTMQRMQLTRALCFDRAEAELQKMIAES